MSTCSPRHWIVNFLFWNPQIKRETVEQIIQSNLAHFREATLMDIYCNDQESPLHHHPIILPSHSLSFLIRQKKMAGPEKSWGTVFTYSCQQFFTEEFKNDSFIIVVFDLEKNTSFDFMLHEGQSGLPLDGFGFHAFEPFWETVNSLNLSHHQAAIEECRNTGLLAHQKASVFMSQLIKQQLQQESTALIGGKDIEIRRL